MKFSTPTGALSGKTVQVILPTEVLRIAVGFVTVWIGGLAALLDLAAVPLCGVELDCAQATTAAAASINVIKNALRMNAPCKNGDVAFGLAQRCIVRHGPPTFPAQESRGVRVTCGDSRPRLSPSEAWPCPSQRVNFEVFAACISWLTRSTWLKTRSRFPPRILWMSIAV